MRLLVWILIKAAIAYFALWFAFLLGRTSATYDFLDLGSGRIKTAPEDIKVWYTIYSKFHGGNQNE